MLRIRVSTASAEITETELITAGRVGLQCAFEFNDAWDGLAKTVIVNGVVKRDIVLVSDTIVVPGECLAREQFPLRIGVYGANGAGEIVIPTIWANFGKILPSARPSGVDPDEVTPDVVAQINQNSSDALRLAQDVLRRADSGEFDGRDGATGPSGPPGTDGRHGKNGNSIWTTTETPAPATGGVAFTQLTGRAGTPPIVGDIIVRSSRYVYEVVEVTSGGVVIGHQIGDIKGAQGVADTIWRTTASIGSVYPSGYVVNVSDLVGRSGATPKAGDLVIGPESGQTGDPTYLYTISGVGSSVAGLDGIGSIKGATGATGPQGPGVTEDLRAALLQLAAKVAYIDDGGATYYQDLYNALYLPSDIVYITAVFNQGTTKVMDTDSLDSLKPMLTVFGRYDDNTSVVLTNYTLTGVLTPGTSTVTVSALGKTTTFDVLVTGMTSISAAYTQGGTVYDTDTLDSLKADLVVTAIYSDSSTATVAAQDYTLSGTLTAGTSTITVAYGGKTTTFSVTVTAVLYNLANQTTSGNQFLTDINLLQTNFPFTIFFDFTNTANPKSGSGNGNVGKWLFQYNGDHSFRGLAIGKAAGSSTVLSLWWNSSTETVLTGTTPNTGRHRIVVTHEANSDLLTVKYKKDNGTILTFTSSSTFVTTVPTTANPAFSFGTNGNHGLPAGTLHLARLYGSVLSSDRIDAFFE